MAVNFLVIGHGGYASGIKSTVELIAGNLTCVQYIDFTRSMSPEDLKVKIIERIPSHQDLIILCDLLGGTPFKIAAGIASRNDSIHVISGANINGILEGILSMNDISTAQVINRVINKTKETTVYFKVKEVSVSDESSQVL